MTRISLSRFLLAAATAVGLAGSGACGDSTGLPPAYMANVVDTAVVYALSGTPIGTPSGFDATTGLPARPELGAPYDFAFDLDADGVALLYPAPKLGLESGAGIQPATKAFDLVTRAPLDEYVSDSVARVDVGTVFLVRSRVSNAGCAYYLGSLPRYGKFEVLAVDDAARTITLKLLINLNCGYRQLEPGIPTS